MSSQATTQFDLLTQFPPARLVRSASLALRVRVLLLAAVGLLAVGAGDWLLSYVGPAAEPVQVVTPIDGDTPLGHWYQHADQAVDMLIGPLWEMVRGVATWQEWWFELARQVWRLLVWGVVGGAISRIAVLDFAHQQSPDVPIAVRFAIERLPTFLGAPLIVLAGLLVVLVPLGLARALVGVPYLGATVALLWPLVLVLAVIAAVYLLAAAIGWPLLWATTAAESSDAFDAVSRMYAYVYQKPLRLLVYVAVAAALACAASVVIEAVTAVALALGTWAQGNSPRWLPSVSLAALAQLPVAFWIASVWSLGCGVYLLRRRDIDNAMLDEVWLPPPRPLGLPELSQPPSGVPEVVTPNETSV